MTTNTKFHGSTFDQLGTDGLNSGDTYSIDTFDTLVVDTTAASSPVAASPLAATPSDPSLSGSLGANPSGSPAGNDSAPAQTADVSDGTTVLYGGDFGGNASLAGAAGSGSSTTTTVKASSGTTTSPFVINITWDSSVASAPAAFKTAVIAAAQYLESQFTDAVTMNIDVGYGEVAGYTLGSNALGSSLSYLSSYSYSAIKSALSKDATSATDTAAVASLGSTSPISGTLWTTTAEAKALGLLTSTTQLDGYVGFSSTLAFTYNDASGVAAGTYDFNGVALHELTEVMGRQLLAGATIGSYANSYSLMDLFHYSAAGVRDFSTSTPGYLSANGGVTSIAALNTQSGGDGGDWSSSMGYNAFDAFSYSGVINAVTTGDLTAIDLLGWNLAGSSSTPANTSRPTGLTVSMVTSKAAQIQTGSALASNTSLAVFGQTGGSTADSYTYSIGGSAASGFTMLASGNYGVLTVGSTALAGSAAGKVYGLTITATDTNSGLSSSAIPVQVVVGSTASTTINVASLSGLVSTSTPTFIFGNGGHEAINASGLSGIAWIVGGSGANTLTGGSYINDYVYGATSDSTASAMDVITNFHAGSDMIDLTGLGQSLSYAGQLSSTATSVAADSIAWKTVGSNTFAYVNTSTGSELLGSTNMQIELQGKITLSSGNFLHA